MVGTSHRADLVGVDWSPVAVAAASSKVGGFVPPGRARFAVGTLEATGLDDGELDAAMCLDAIFFATDRIAVLREVRRVLRPGGRFLFTADELARPELPHPARTGHGWWRRRLRGGGEGAGAWGTCPAGSVCTLWLEHVDQIRALHGEFSAALMEQEASEVGPTMDERSGVVVTCRRD